jgi:hypothetical protein
MYLEFVGHAWNVCLWVNWKAGRCLDKLSSRRSLMMRRKRSAPGFLHWDRHGIDEITIKYPKCGA